MNINKHFNLLGLRVEDRVTGFKGVVTSLCFDLYGCIQVALNPGLDKEGKQRDSLWFDLNRVKVLSTKPVMDRPNFVDGPGSEGDKGPAEKPAFSKV